MYRLSEMVGRSIVSSQTGDRVGKVVDVVARRRHS